jgi:hypothetical protein
MTNKKGIDYSKDNIYDALGRPDLKPKVEEAKKQIQTSAEYLANLCLENSTFYQGYTDEDLFNATEIFSHVLFDVVYSENMDLSHKAKLELAENTGKAIRELILASTGKDMHGIVKTLYDQKDN